MKLIASSYAKQTARLAALSPIKLNQFQRQSIADRCQIHGHKRPTVAREYGVHVDVANAICDQAMFERGRRVERVAAKFFPPMQFAYKA